MHLSPEEKQSLVARYHTGNSAAEICADTGIVRSTCGPSRTHSRGLYCFQPIGMTGSLALAAPYRLYRGPEEATLPPGHGAHCASVRVVIRTAGMKLSRCRGFRLGYIVKGAASAE